MIVDAAERCFVPLCIYNNTRGDADARTREQYREPAWNNPVVRIVSAAGADLVARLHSDWSVGALAGAMVAALRKSKANVPSYLGLLAAEERARKRRLESAVFAMG